MKKIIVISALFLCLANFAQAADFITLDTVYSFTPGTGQNAGQDSAYFPANIFGTPCAYADSIAPASSPSDLLSLGLGGEIVVGFKNFSVIDGEGDDFFTFENVMYNLLAQKYFVEPAKVAVSKNGVDWYEFPFDSLTLAGCAGVHPTYKDSTGDGFTGRGGDGFDIAKSGFDEINYIKITDVSSIVKSNKQHPFYDATISGFDLDAVVAVHFKSKGAGIAENSVTHEKSMTSREFLREMENSDGIFSVIDINGNKIVGGSLGELRNFFDSCADGVYFATHRFGSGIDFYKLIK